MHPESDTATIDRDLRAVDAALAGGAAAHDDPAARELQELALALQADAVSPDDAFAALLRERVREGFPAEPGSLRARADAAGESVRGLRRRLPSPARLLPAAAAVVTVLAIGLAVNSLDPQFTGSGDDDDGGGGGGSVVQDSGGGGGGGAEAAPGADSGASAGKAEPALPLAQPDRDESLAAPSTGRTLRRGFAPGRSDRRIERSISMTLEAPNAEIPAVAQDVTRVTNRHGGFVLSSTLDSDDDGASGYFELRIPAARLRPALADLAGLATVKSQSQSGQDVTRRHVTTEDRLQAARAERRSLLRRLEVAETDEEAESIRRRLDIVAGEINGLRGLLRELRLRTNYAVVTVDLAGTGDDSSGGGAGGSFDDALSDAGDLLVGLTGALIRIMAIALPLALIGGLGWLAARILRRRRRESVLA